MKTFCPNCEKETSCVYIAELYECKECGCDFESKQRQMQERLDAATARAEKAEARAERYDDALQQIHNWAIAYPLDVFPEPDFKRVREVLEAAGITLDSVSASNMRHVITGVARIVEKALKGGEG